MNPEEVIKLRHHIKLVMQEFSERWDEAGLSPHEKHVTMCSALSFNLAEYVIKNNPTSTPESFGEICATSFRIVSRGT